MDWWEGLRWGKEGREGWNGERGGAGGVGRSRMVRGEERGGVE